MRARFSLRFLCLCLLLVSCSGVETSSAPQPVGPPTTTSAPLELLPKEEGIELSPETRDLLEDLQSIDTALEEIDNEVCLAALTARAEIEALLQQGQDVNDLAVAIDELISELQGCALTPAPTR